ncbi:MAG: glucosidase family protein [Armatimonadota bacterium]
MKHPSPQLPNTRWRMTPDGAIEWQVQAAHADHIEMSGRRVSLILRYGVDEQGRLLLDRQIVWPMLRTIPNDTHASLSHSYGLDVFPPISVDGLPRPEEKPAVVRIRGMVSIHSRVGDDIELTRVLFPSTRKAAVIERCTITNWSNRVRLVVISPYEQAHQTEVQNGVYGAYSLSAKAVGCQSAKLQPGRSVEFSLVFTGRLADEPPIEITPKAELRARKDYVSATFQKLRFECPEPVLSREFDFTKLRAAESIFETKGGLMHAPGGGSYYAAIWANDQAEYASLFFPFLGDAAGNESALVCYRQFARFMKPDYKPVPSSIIAEGTDIWNGAGDRGDAAMIAYGATRYALVSGSKKIASEMWPIVKWCLEFCRRKTNEQGVVESDSDELEGRFPAGKANLCTSALTYDALRSAAWLGEELGQPQSVVSEYRDQAAALRISIENCFGAQVEGFHTYRYYDGNSSLRAWICIPLTMGLFERKRGTIAALFSPRLWTDDGLATEAGQETFWDRATLYALRGVFAAGETALGMDYLRKYSQRRLLGEHVPYPVEAWPEGGQRHLSAESALYCRVITEGLFGIRPVGLHAFECTPHLPDGWNNMELRSIHAFGRRFDIAVSRKADRLVLDVLAGQQLVYHAVLTAGETVKVVLP